ncbi:NUDIX hydrolase [Allorhizobium sp. BGMRC 0089]|uniref:NUDIX hydrolase n=1 Tax=Allorhizobium sonneratiae TaxID=2934936 RepID=UPI002034958A|nr:NUDIX hydrolase [Allorhizobium sonneratiae]MCM2290925.1 NUDIX hydrolase [Allorhizobium sonneratiae]
MTSERHMIRLDKKPQLFSFRVAGLIFQEGHVLVQQGAGDRYWAFPGGRAEIGESTEETIIREMREELDREVGIDRLLLTVENFFSFDDYRAHELGFYYLLTLKTPLPFHRQEIVHRVIDGPTEVLFRWVPAHADSFAMHDIRPAFLANYITRLPERVEHLIVHEGQSRP